jgi:hypothetical protein
MGTSTGYSAPPSWGDLKSDVTRAGGAGALVPNTARGLMQSFIQHNGGANAIARGGAGGGGGGSVARGRAARATAGRLGGFISEVGRVGLDQALRDAGWADLVGRPVPEVMAALLDRLGGEASTIDDVDARMALARLQDKYFADAVDAAELDQRLVEQAPQLEVVLHDYFGFYLYEVFCRVFFERLVQRLGDTRAHSFLDQIRDFITAALANRAAGTDIRRIDWTGPAGQALTADIMEATLTVFG